MAECSRINLILVVIVTVLFNSCFSRVLAHSGSCFDKFPDYEVSSGTSPGLIAYGNTGGDFITCEKKCRDDWKCYAFTQYFEGEFPNSGLCYGREYGEDILVAVDTAYVVVSGVKIPCRYDSQIELFDGTSVGPYSTEQGTVFKNSEDTVNPTTVSLRVYGPAAWMVHTGEAFSGRELVVTEGFWKTSSLGHIGANTIKSIKKIDLCSERPIGTQNFYILSNSAFTQWQALEERALPYRARLNAGYINDIDGHGALEVGNHIAGGWVHYHNTCCDYGIQLDLGGLYRISSIGTQGTCSCSANTLSSAYYVSQFQISYSVDGKEFEYYSLNGNRVNFAGNTGDDYSKENLKTFDPSFVASSVRVVTKTGFWLGLRFELYGCAVDVPDTQPLVINEERSTNIMDPGVLVDSNTGTCIDLETLGRNVLKLPTGQYAQSTLTMKATYSFPEGCSRYSDVIFLVHNSPPLHLNTQGTFTKCDFMGQEMTLYSAVITYQCTCQYGFCETIVIRTKTNISCGSLCEVSKT